MQLSFDTIAGVCSGQLVYAPCSVKIAQGLVWDSRLVKSDYLYAALLGNRVDGYDFCIPAIESGAAGVLIDKPADDELLAMAQSSDAAIIVVNDVLDAITTLAQYWRNQIQAKVIALTGSNGKTTTKNLLRRVLSAQGNCVATLANQNNEIGIPATLLRAEKDTDTLVVEMGMRGLGQIDEACSIASPDYSLITNVGVAHMELLGSRDNIARAKAEIIAGTKVGGKAFVNSSDDYAHQLADLGQARKHDISMVYFDGSGTPAESYDDSIRPCVYARDISLDALGCPTFTLCTPTGSSLCSLQLPGLINVHNACAAAAVAYELGMDANAIAAALSEEEAEQGRAQVRIASSGTTVIDDSYNANPDSMIAALDTFASMQVQGKRIAVLGDMGELGSLAEEGHRSVGQKVATSSVDTLICIGPLSRVIQHAACEAGMSQDSVIHVDNAHEALEALESVVSPDDCVLVKASHSLELSQVVEGLVL